MDLERLVTTSIAARFTMAEAAVLSVVAAEVARRGLCRLTIGQIAGQAGACKQTVRNAVRQAVALGVITSDEWRLTAWRNAPNTVKIISPEWVTWLRLRGRSGEGRSQPTKAVPGGGYKFVEPTNTRVYSPLRSRSEFEKRGGKIHAAFLK